MHSGQVYACLFASSAVEGAQTGPAHTPVLRCSPLPHVALNEALAIATTPLLPSPGHAWQGFPVPPSTTGEPHLSLQSEKRRSDEAPMALESEAASICQHEVWAPAEGSRKKMSA